MADHCVDGIEAGQGPVVTAAVIAAVAPTHAEATAEQPRDDGGRVCAKPVAVADDGKQRSFGNASDYLAARIARDAPEVHERMKAH